MPLKLPPTLFNDLRAAQDARGYSDEVTQRLGVVWLHTDMGPSYYLTDDGRVLADDVIDGTPIHEIMPPEIYPALVAASITLSAAELLTLLPPRSVGGVDCVGCGGTRRLKIGRDLVGRPSTIICPTCHGLAWQFTAIAVELVAPGLLVAPGEAQRGEGDLVPTESIHTPVQFCRTALSGPSGQAVVIVLNNSPSLPADTRLVIAAALVGRYEQASIAFIDSDSPGQTHVSTATDSDPFAVATATATYKAACGWDESEQFRICVDHVPYTIRMAFENGKWRGTLPR
jgi:hypothetical protein